MIPGIKRITVLNGGWSSEREISLKSGSNVKEVLQRLGYEVRAIDAKKDLRSLLDQLDAAKPDFIFNTLHGSGGEDGIIQGLLEIYGVPYNTSGVLSSAVSFNKAVAKVLVNHRGVRVIPGFECSFSKLKVHELELPVVVKPTENGSSVGVYILKNQQDLDELLTTNWSYGDQVLVENFIEGREFTILVVNKKAVGTLEIKPKNEFYDFESKYRDGGSVHLSTFEMPYDTESEMLRMAELAYEACYCRGMARIDFIYSNSDKKVYFLEINTQPGMTAMSLVPDIVRHKGITQEELLEEIICSCLDQAS